MRIDVIASILLSVPGAWGTAPTPVPTARADGKAVSSFLTVFHRPSVSSAGPGLLRRGISTLFGGSRSADVDPLAGALDEEAWAAEDPAAILARLALKPILKRADGSPVLVALSPRGGVGATTRGPVGSITIAESEWLPPTPDLLKAHNVYVAWLPSRPEGPLTLQKVSAAVYQSSPTAPDLGGKSSYISDAIFIEESQSYLIVERSVENSNVVRVSKYPRVVIRGHAEGCGDDAISTTRGTLQNVVQVTEAALGGVNRRFYGQIHCLNDAAGVVQVKHIHMKVPLDECPSRSTREAFQATRDLVIKSCK